jgi:hypothetical protein
LFEDVGAGPISVSVMVRVDDAVTVMGGGGGGREGGVEDVDSDMCDDMC